jgi:endonuclease YncB( thermonuclease family)
MSIRLAQVDTPEIKGKCDKEKRLAQKAKQHTVRMLRSGNNITLQNLKRGKYFRLVADVSIDGVDLAISLIKNGLAVTYDGGRKTKDWCE